MEQKKIDKFTADLLKKSLLKIPSEDFTDRVMNKITSSATSKFNINGYFRKAWIFFVLALIFMPMAYLFSTEIFMTYFTVIHDSLKQSFVFVKYFAFIAFIVMVFFQLDMLVRHYFSRPKDDVVVG